MMKIELMDHITLEDDRVFIVSNITTYKGKVYYLLLNIENHFDIMVAYIDNEDLVVVDNPYEYIEILKRFDTDKVLKGYSKEEIIRMKLSEDENDSL